MSAPDTRGSGAWQSEILTENSVTQTPLNLLDTVTQTCNPEIQARLVCLKEHLSDLKKTLEEKENAARYIHDFLDFNASETSSGCEELLKSIASDVKETKTKMTKVEHEIGSLSVNFDRLSTRVQNTEHKLGMTPSSETMPIPSYKPGILIDKRCPESLQNQQPQIQQQHQGLNQRADLRKEIFLQVHSKEEVKLWLKR